MAAKIAELRDLNDVHHFLVDAGIADEPNSTSPKCRNASDGPIQLMLTGPPPKEEQRLFCLPKGWKGVIKMDKNAQPVPDPDPGG